MSDIYDGPATIRTGTPNGGAGPIVRPPRPDRRPIPLAGNGFRAPSRRRQLPQQVILAVGDNHAEARITERTPQGGYSVAGVGAPPFALDDLEVDVPVS